MTSSSSQGTHYWDSITPTLSLRPTCMRPQARNSTLRDPHLQDTGFQIRQETRGSVFSPDLTRPLSSLPQGGSGWNSALRQERGQRLFRPGDELKHQIEMASILERESSSFHRHLIDYPNARPEGLDESFFWVNSVLDEKPTVALVHRMGLLGGGVYLYMERYFYVSRSHNSVQGVGGAFPVSDGTSTVVCYRSRTSTKQVSGIGARMMGSKMSGNFERAREIAGRKQELEAVTNSGV